MSKEQSATWSRLPVMTGMTFGSDCIVNGVEIKAGTEIKFETPGAHRSDLADLLWTLYEGLYGHRKAENIDPFKTAVGGALEVNKAWKARGEPERQQQAAWHDVWRLLNEVYPGGLLAFPGSGSDKACAAIRDLAARSSAVSETEALEVARENGYAAGRASTLTSPMSATRRSSGWVRVKADSLPDKGDGAEEVLGATITGHVVTVSPLHIHRLHKEAMENGEFCFYSHWMPLPEVPGE